MLAGFHQPVRRSRSRSKNRQKVNGRSLYPKSAKPFSRNAAITVVF